MDKREQCAQQDIRLRLAEYAFLMQGFAQKIAKKSVPEFHAEFPALIGDVLQGGHDRSKSAIF